jgi:hypothetical protein
MGLFIFNKSLVSTKSVVDGTADIDLYAVPIPSLVNITSTTGVVTLYFKNGNSYDSFVGGSTAVQGYPYAQVSLSVNAGQEQATVKNIAGRIGSYNRGETSTITIDVPSGLFTIPTVTGIISITRFNDFTTL